MEECKKETWNLEILCCATVIGPDRNIKPLTKYVNKRNVKLCTFKFCRHSVPI